MDRARLLAHIHEQFPEPVFQEVLTTINSILGEQIETPALIDKLHDVVIDLGDQYPKVDPYCVALWCLEKDRLVTYQEWLDKIDHTKP